MGRGILSGLFWGSIISVAVLGAVSQLAPLPEQRASLGPDTAATPGETPDSPDDSGESADSSEQSTPSAPVARLETPEAESTPDSPPADAAPGVKATVPEDDLASAVSVPAGSEFRRPPQETEAALPSTDSTPDDTAAPAVPAGDASEAAVDLSEMAGAVRPETPGMSITAPAAPDTGEAAPDMGDTVSGGPVIAGPRVPIEPAIPESDPGEATPAVAGSGGFPPPVTPEAVQAAGVPALADAAEQGSPVQGGETLRAEEIASADVAMAEPMPKVASETMDASQAEPAEDAAPESTDAVTAQPVVPAEMNADSTDPVDQPSVTAQVPDMAQPSVGSAETAPETEGDVVASLQDGADVVQTPPSEPAPSGSDAMAALPADAAAPVPATQPDALPESDATAERPERMEVEQAAPGEPAPQVGDAPKVRSGVRVVPLTERKTGFSRLPQIGVGDDAQAPDAVEAETPDADGEIPADSKSAEWTPRLDALSRNAVAFSNPEGKPLFSVILIDDGSGGLDRNVLTTFSFPVTFAIDPTRADAAEAAAAYSGDGFEVVALATGLPGNEQPRDVEVVLEAHLSTVPQAVAIMDPASSGFGQDRALAEHVLEIAAEDGHGVIGWDRGLGSVKATADRSGQAAALIYRPLDKDDERSPVIRRYLDRAAFQAGQEGSVIMVGRARAETVKALFEWASSRKAEQVTLAPVSAVLRAR